MNHNLTPIGSGVHLNRVNQTGPNQSTRIRRPETNLVRMVSPVRSTWINPTWFLGFDSIRKDTSRHEIITIIIKKASIRMRRRTLASKSSCACPGIWQCLMACPRVWGRGVCVLACEWHALAQFILHAHLWRVGAYAGFSEIQKFSILFPFCSKLTFGPFGYNYIWFLTYWSLVLIKNCWKWLCLIETKPVFAS